MQAIFQFQDYRDYLREYYHFQKSLKSTFSHRTFAIAAGLKSPNYLKLIMDGERNLTITNIHRFARAMSLTPDEVNYFEALVLFNQAETEDESHYYRQRLDVIASQTPKRMAKLTIDQLLGAWYYPAVWAILDSKEAPVSPQTVAEIVGISADRALQAIELLQEKGLVEVREGRYVLRQDCILFNDKRLINQAQKRYLRDQLQRSIDEFDRHYSKGSKFFSQTLTIGATHYQLYVDRVLSFLNSLSQASNDEIPESVVQLNVQLFSLSKKNNPP